MKKYSLFIVASDLFQRLGMRTLLLTLNPELSITEFNNFSDWQDYLNEELPDIACIDAEVIPCPKHENISSLKKQYPSVRWIIIDKRLRFSNNADLLLLSNQSHDEVVKGIQSFFKQINTPIQRDEALQLTEREQEVLKHIALGYSNKEISELLYVSIHTVITHRRNVTEKLGIKTISGLTVYALINGYVEPEQVQARSFCADCSQQGIVK